MTDERLTTDIENGKFFHYEPDENGAITGISYQAVDDIIAKGRVPVLSVPVNSFKLLLASRHYPTMQNVFLRPHEVDALEGRATGLRVKASARGAEAGPGPDLGPPAWLETDYSSAIVHGRGATDGRIGGSACSSRVVDWRGEPRDSYP